MMIFFILAFTFSLFILEYFYFYLANKYNIIDKPNQRSLHETVTIRGGGIIFYIGALIFFVYSKFQLPFFFLGLTSISLISFIDDIKSVSNRIRIVFHTIGICFLFYELEMLSQPWWVVLAAAVISIGTINAYNFMDGINGITGGYSLVFLISVAFVNTDLNFISNDFLILISLSVLVFNFFNFRKKALCFAGDVGSISMAFIVVFLLIKLMLLTESLLFILFLSLYGVDTVLTILYRLSNKENIFQAHKSHLFQVLVYKHKLSHLQVTSIYMVCQFFLNCFIIWLFNKNLNFQILGGISLLLILTLVYIYIKGTPKKFYKNF